MTYGTHASDGMIGYDEVLTSSPAVLVGGDPHSWEPTQRWDQHSRLFVDIRPKSAARSAK